MTCHHMRDDKGNVIGIICSHNAPKKCKVCGSRATKLCDFPAPDRKSGTCDLDLCVRCAASIEHEVDYCPAHAKQAKEDFEERAGIKEFAGNMPREQAEREAWKEVYGKKTGNEQAEIVYLPFP